MKKVILYEPSIGSDNIGDQIIVDGVKRALQEYLNDGGMRALQNRHRTLIIGVDNRAQELHKDYGVPVVDEKSMDKLDEIINSDFSTNIKLPNENIRRFLKQFDECK